jgi:hypothetical protein
VRSPSTTACDRIARPATETGCERQNRGIPGDLLRITPRLCAYFARRAGRGDVEDLVAETFVVAVAALTAVILLPASAPQPKESYGRDVNHQPFDYTTVENVNTFQRLPDTPENRRLLELNGPRQ